MEVINTNMGAPTKKQPNSAFLYNPSPAFATSNNPSQQISSTSANPALLSGANYTQYTMDHGVSTPNDLPASSDAPITNTTSQKPFFNGSTITLNHNQGLLSGMSVTNNYSSYPQATTTTTAPGASIPPSGIDHESDHEEDEDNLDGESTEESDDEGKK